MSHTCTRHYILHSHAPRCRCYQDKVDLVHRERFYPFIPEMKTRLRVSFESRFGVIGYNGFKSCPTGDDRID